MHALCANNDMQIVDFLVDQKGGDMLKYILEKVAQPINRVGREFRELFARVRGSAVQHHRLAHASTIPGVSQGHRHNDGEADPEREGLAGIRSSSPGASELDPVELFDGTGPRFHVLAEVRALLGWGAAAGDFIPCFSLF